MQWNESHLFKRCKEWKKNIKIETNDVEWRTVENNQIERERERGGGRRREKEEMRKEQENTSERERERDERERERERERRGLLFCYKKM